MSGPNWKLEEDLETVTLSFPTNPPVAIKLNAQHVDDLLRNLGDMRALMKPPIQADWPLGQKFVATLDPRWVSEPEMMAGDSVLHIRDPRFGWLHYVIPRETAKLLQGILAAQTDNPPPLQAPGKTS